MYVSAHVRAEFSRVVIGDRVALAASQRNAIRRSRVYLLRSSLSMQAGTSRGKLLPRNSRDLKLFLSIRGSTDD